MKSFLLWPMLGQTDGRTPDRRIDPSLHRPTMRAVPEMYAVVKVDRRIRWHYTTTILHWCTIHEVSNCKFHNFARTISRHADGISRYSVPPSAGPLLPLNVWYVAIRVRVFSVGQGEPAFLRLYLQPPLYETF